MVCETEYLISDYIESFMLLVLLALMDLDTEIKEDVEKCFTLEFLKDDLMAD